MQGICKGNEYYQDICKIYVKEANIIRYMQDI